MHGGLQRRHGHENPHNIEVDGVPWHVRNIRHRMVGVDTPTGSVISGNIKEHANDDVACPVPPVHMPVRLTIEAPAITPSEPTPAIVPTEPVQLAPSEVDNGTDRNV